MHGNWVLLVQHLHEMLGRQALENGLILITARSATQQLLKNPLLVQMVELIIRIHPMWVRARGQHFLLAQVRTLLDLH